MVSTTLNLVDHLLARGRYLQQIGRTLDALRIFARLASFRELPAAAAEETQFRLGELWLRRRKFRRARRHLAAALGHAPDSARYHFLMAQALDNDRDGDLDRAAEHYRTALELDRTQTDCLCAYGKLALRLGRTEEGLDCLRSAAAQAPDDLKVLARVSEALRLAGRADEARRLLLAARFRHRRDGRYHKLWNDFQFHTNRRTQEAARRAKVRAAGDSGPVLLPFVRPERPATSTSLPGKILRHDGPSSPAPHLGHSARRSDQRQAR